MLSPIPRRGGWDRRFCSCSPNHGSLPRKRGRVGPRIVLFEACSAFTSRYGLHTRHVTVFRDAFVTRGFNRFVTSTVAPVASGWSIFAGWDSHPLESAALARRTRIADSEPASPCLSVRRKLQLPHHRLKARLLAQPIHERIGFQVDQSRVAQAHRGVEPLERLRAIAPLRRSWRIGRRRHRLLQP